MFFPHTVLPSDEGSGILGALTLMAVSAVINSHGTPVAALQQLYVQKDVKPMVLGIVGDSEASQASIANSLTGQTIWHSFKAPNRPLVLAAYPSSPFTLPVPAGDLSRLRKGFVCALRFASYDLDLVILTLTSFNNTAAFAESLAQLPADPSPLDLHTWLENREWEYWRPLLFMFHICHLIVVRLYSLALLTIGSCSFNEAISHLTRSYRAPYAPSTLAR